MTYNIELKGGTLIVTDTLFEEVLKKPVLALKVGDSVCSKLASFNDKASMKRFLECFGEVKE